MERRIIAAFAVTEPLTKESFIEVMKTLWADATHNYRRIYDEVATPAWTAWYKKYTAECIENAEAFAKKYAAKKWKTEKRRNQFVEEYISKTKLDFASRVAPEFEPLTFVDFDVNPGYNGLSGNCCISEFDDKHLGKCFDEIKDNEYFKAATVISIGYTEANSRWETYHDALCHFRPQVYLTLPAELEKKWKDEASALAEDVRNFYANCNYCGD